MMTDEEIIALAQKTGFRPYGPMTRERSEDGETVVLRKSHTLSLLGIRLLQFAREVEAASGPQT